MSRIRRAVSLAMIVALLGGCASVDQFGSRIYDANVNSQAALDQETLLNILRAARYQNPNFVAITQITGGQTEAVTTGFPTFTIGPHAAPTLVTNSLATGLSGGYQSNPLVSSQFEEGILSPVTERAAAQLLRANIREAVFYTIIQSVIFKINGKYVTFLNDPSDDVDRQSTEPAPCSEKIKSWNAQALLKDDTSCRYSKFENFLGKFLEFGLTAELKLKDEVSAPSSTKTTGKGEPAKADKTSGAVKPGSSDAAASKQTSGFFCYDPAQSTRFYQNSALSKRQCGLPYKTGDIVIKFTGVDIQLEKINLRSLAQIYSYLGSVQRNESADRVKYYAKSGLKLMGSDGKFLNIERKLDLDCAVSVVFERTPYCVPPEASNTLVIISILEQIRNISIQPSDLNSAFTVRLSNG